MRIEPYVESDREALFDICLRTADAGGDASGLCTDDDLMPNIFLAPYLHLDPELAFVARDAGGRARGYVVGTSDTDAFAAAYRSRWIPHLADRYGTAPEEPANPLGTRHPPGTRDAQMLGLHFRPERMIRPELRAYPAHLHVDLLPNWQHQGLGRALLDRFFQALAKRSVPGVHVAVTAANVRAIGFYERLGFSHVAVPSEPGAAFLVLPIAASR